MKPLRFAAVKVRKYPGLASALITLVIITILAELSARQPDPGDITIVYDAAEFEPLDTAVCPGETLQIPISGRNLGERSLVIVAGAIYEVGQPVPIVRPTTPFWIPIPEDDERRFSFIFSLPVPEDLPAADYLYAHVATELGTSPAGFEAYFTVEECSE